MKTKDELMEAMHKAIQDINRDTARKIAAIETEFSIRDKYSKDFMFYASNNQAQFTIRSRDEIPEILETFPPVNETTSFKVSGEERVIDSPYRVDLRNPPVVNSVQQHELRISYQAERFGVSIVIPTKMCLPYVQVSQRRLYSSEFHYFIGTSYRKLREMTVKTYTFKNSNVVKWYGGNITQCDPTYILEIIFGQYCSLS